MSRRASCVGLVATVLSLLPAAAAAAATVDVERSPNGAVSVRFLALHEERNDVVLVVGTGVIEVTDRAAPVQAGSECTQLDEHRASCPLQALHSVSVSLADGDDRYTGPETVTGHLTVSVVTGEGDDIVHGGAPNEYIANQDGDDVIAGGAGIDGFSQPNEQGVHISLDGIANDGPAGGRGNVAADVESLSGGPGPDVLIGGPGDDSLMGNAGDDVLVGGEGEDSLTGGPGNDRLDGGADRDRFMADEGWLTGPWVDQITCGEGEDWGWVDDEDVVAPDCDVFFSPSRKSWSRELTPPMPSVRARAQVRGRALLVRLRCPKGTVDCGGAVTVEARRTRLARKRYFVVAGRTKRVRMPLTRSGRRLLAGRSRLAAVARIRTNGSRPAAHTTRLVVRR